MVFVPFHSFRYKTFCNACDSPVVGPTRFSNWEDNWEDVSSFFQSSDEIRRIMYTTNIIEGLDRQYRKVTKTKSVSSSDIALEKMLYLASRNVVKNGHRDTGTGIRCWTSWLYCSVTGLLYTCEEKRRGSVKKSYCPCLIPSAYVLFPENNILIQEAGYG